MSAPTSRRRRRPHKAGGGRIVATGFGAGALLGIVGAIGATSPPTGGTSAPPRVRPAVVPADATAATRRAPATTTPTTIVWRTVHRVIVVDDPPAVPASGAVTAGSRVASRGYAPAPKASYPSVPTAPAPAPQPAPVVAAPAPAPAPPACSGSKCP